MSRKTLAGEPFVATRIISLGGRCAVAHNLRRFFDFGEAFPFDWWITPFDGLIKFLAHPDPDWLYDPAKLDLTANNGSVRHADLGIRLHHEFPRDRIEGQPINPSFRDTIAMPKARTTRLIKKLLALDTEGESLVFVRERERPEPVDELMPVLAALYQKAEWRSLAVPHVASDDSVHGWEGDPALWDKALADLPIQFARRDPKRYTVSQPHAEVH